MKKSIAEELLRDKVKIGYFPVGDSYDSVKIINYDDAVEIINKLLEVDESGRNR